jgi:dTDP-4-dehydrorhamnose 3,5-epimerase
MAVIFTEAPLAGAFVIEPEPVEDERGFFARTWCEQEFGEIGLISRLVQCSISWNRTTGTVRGMHYQVAPHEEVKIVRCTRGSIFDVILDLRPNSATFKACFSVVLSADNRLMLYVPEGVAHGFQAMEDGTEVFYQISTHYVADATAGVRWNDPSFDIRWPLPVTVISERDRNFPDFYA